MKNKKFECIEIRDAFDDEETVNSYFENEDFYESKENNFYLFDLTNHTDLSDYSNDNFKNISKSHILALAKSENVDALSVKKEIGFELQPLVSMSRQMVYRIFTELPDRIEEVIVTEMDVKERDLNAYEYIKNLLSSKDYSKNTEVNQVEYSSKEEIPDDENRSITYAKVYYKTEQEEVCLAMDTKLYFQNASFNQAKSIVEKW